MYHNPVLLNESLEALHIKPDGLYVDATFGGGGHSKHILNSLSSGHLYGFDQDIDAINHHTTHPNLTLIQQNFRYMINYLQFFNAIPVDGILADLGISSHQIDVPDRGFATRFSANLDMRMNQEDEFSAADIINSFSLERLTAVFRNYGEIKNAFNLARKIIAARDENPICTTDQLNNVAEPLAPKKQIHKYLAQVYQALRIEVNDELGALQDLLYQAQKVLKPGGRLVVISYHSLEDRLVKNFLKTGNFDGKQEKDFYGNLITPFKMEKTKPIYPNETEIETNNRARSARLRTGIKV